LQIVAASQSDNSCGQPSSIEINEESVWFQWFIATKNAFPMHIFNIFRYLSQYTRCSEFAGRHALVVLLRITFIH
jgi:hypothetical protein